MNKATLMERWREHPHFGYLQRLSVDPFLRDIAEDGAEAELVGALKRLSEEVRKTEWRQPFNQRSTVEWSAEERAVLMERDAESARIRRGESS